MGVRGLNQVLKEKSHSEPINVLSGARIGIDAFMWLRRLMPAEWAVSFMGGIPLTLFAAIENELNRFRAAKIKPLFVFAGIPAISLDFPRETIERSSDTRFKAWDLLFQGPDKITQARIEVNPLVGQSPGSSRTQPLTSSCSSASHTRRCECCHALFSRTRDRFLPCSLQCSPPGVSIPLPPLPTQRPFRRGAAGVDA